MIDGRRYSSLCECIANARYRVPQPRWQTHRLDDFHDHPWATPGQAPVSAASFARTGQDALVASGPCANRPAVAVANATTDAGRPPPCFFRAQALSNDLEINFRAHYPRYPAYPARVVVRAPSYEAMREREAANFPELIEYRTDFGYVSIVASDFNHHPVTHAGHIDTDANDTTVTAKMAELGLAPDKLLAVDPDD